MHSAPAQPKNGILRSILTVVASLIAGSVVMLAVQSANYALFPPPEGLDYEDPEQLQQIVDAMPLAALWILELSYALGCLVAGAAVALGVRDRPLTHALVVGAIFTVLGWVNLAQIPTPLWLAVLTTLTYVPATLVGALVTGGWRSKDPRAL